MELVTTPQAINNVTSEQLRQYTEEHHEQDYVIVDVRQPEEYAQGHIPGSLLVPLGELESQIDKLRALRDKTVVFYCRSGARSARAAAWVKGAVGLGKVANLLGGFLDYRGAGLIDFPRLKPFELCGSTEALLHQALDLEKGTHRLYELLGERIETGPAASVISTLAKAEVAHGKAIHRILEELNPGAVGSFEELFASLPGDLIESGETYEAVVARARELGVDGEAALLELVLEIELTAYDLYKNLAADASSLNAQRALVDLAQQEKQHADMVFRAISDLAKQPRDGWRPREEQPMEIRAFFDERTSTLTYVVWDSDTRDAVVIDPVMDYDPAASTTWTESVDEVITFLNKEHLKLHYVLETHAHADHLSGSQLLKQACPNVRVAIGRRITAVQGAFKKIFSLPDDFPTDGRQFDVLLDEGEPLRAGSLTIETKFTPGHTPACTTLKIGDAMFTGDALFMPDGGAGRCDFPGGSAEDLYDSVTKKIYSEPDDTRIFVGHDYQPGGRELRYETTVGEQKRKNVALNATTTLERFVEFRRQRDAQLPAPKLLFQSVQVNVDAGRLPDPEKGEIKYLKIPLNVFKPKGAGEIQLLDTCEAVQRTGAQG